MNEKQAEKLLLYIELAIAEAISSSNAWIGHVKFYHEIKEKAKQSFLDSLNT